MAVLVVGYGKSGKDAAQLLLKLGKQVIITDRNRPKEIKESLLFLFEPAQVDWSCIEQVILSPGIAPSHLFVKEAKRRCIEVIGEAELALRHLKNRCIAITGTNGKTTTTLFLVHLLKRSNKKARALGNIGETLSGYAMDPDPEEILVIELSSFQLETLETKAFDAALCLNITPDHLDRHKTMRSYAETKCRLRFLLKEGASFHVSAQVMRDFPDLCDNARVFNSREAIASISLMRYTKLELSDQMRAFALYPICSDFGVEEELLFSELKTVRPPRHRMEYVGCWKGLHFYNDSKATNVDAVVHAIHSLKGPIVLLAGGVHKGASYLPWVEAFGSKVKMIAVFGPAAELIEQELKGCFLLYKAKSLQDALTRAIRFAKEPLSIVLSPGCSSFDAFRNFEERGDAFMQMIEERIWIEKKRS